MKPLHDAFPSGIKKYVWAKAIVAVAFPVNDKGNIDARCELCKYYRPHSKRCDLTQDIVFYPEKISAECPLEIESEE